MTKARQLADLGNAYDDGALSNRNLIINGSMTVNQRGQQTSVNNGYTVDRFYIRSGGSARFTTDKSSDVPSGEGFGSSLHINVTTADTSVGTSDFGLLRHIFEGQDLQSVSKGSSNAKPVTLQFWIKSTVTGTYAVELYDEDNTRQVSQNYTVSAANTWEKKTLTFPADTVGAFDNDNNDSLYIQWGLSMGTNFTSGTLNTTWGSITSANRFSGQVNAFSSTSNNIYITGVQLEVGDTATPFEHRSYGDELAKCQRYYQVFKEEGTATFGVAFAFSGNAAYDGSQQIFPVKMRAVPSRSTSGTWSTTDGTGSIIAITQFHGTTNSWGYQLGFSVASGLSQFRPYGIRALANSGSQLKFDAEL